MRRASRREFLKSSVTASCAAGLSGAFVECAATARGLLPHAVPDTASSTAPLPIKKGVLLDMLPENQSYADRFKLARAVGFEVVQAPTEPDQGKAEEIKESGGRLSQRADRFGDEHGSLEISALSSSDPDVVEKSLAGMRTSLHNAKLWGSDVVLLVPAVVNPQTSYR